MTVDKKENFERIAQARLEKINKAITSLENLSNRSYYDYTTEQINELFDTIQASLDSTREKFQAPSKRKKVRL